MNKKLIIFVLFLISVQFLSADGIIKEINFIGLKRTKESTALQIIRPVEIGQVFTEITEETIVQELREAGIFNPEITIESRMDDLDKILDIYVKDKWTLIPVPVISVSKNGSWRAGALALEGNLLGYYKTMGFGLFLGSEGWSLLSIYRDNLFLDTDLKFTSSLNLGLKEVTDEDVQEKTIRKYQEDEIGFGLKMEYPLTERFSVAGGWIYNRSIIQGESSNQSNVPDLHSTGISGELKWKDLYYDIPYEFGLLASASYRWNWGFQDTADYPGIQGRMSWGINPLMNHLLIFNANGGWTVQNPVQKQFRLGGFPGTLILPMGRIAADEFLSSTAVYNIPLWRFPGGTLSLKSFYEGGFYKSDLAEKTLFHGPGAGIDIFINDLAIPAIQMNISWNLETGRYQINAGIGIGGGQN